MGTYNPAVLKHIDLIELYEKTFQQELNLFWYENDKQFVELIQTSIDTNTPLQDYRKVHNISDDSVM